MAASCSVAGGIDEGINRWRSKKSQSPRQGRAAGLRAAAACQIAARL
jgi:hypothetical protein